MTVEEFIGIKAQYDLESWMIFGISEDGKMQLIADVRGWGAIQNLFKNKDKSIDLHSAAEFQDKIGLFIAEAITEKLKSTKNDKP